ncbi:hypothetical protein EJ08DRAFT_732197 [Tothia fuscella]|uniref:BZIP domain-containing protein n=1 Tax=Tothia fuscella TaxID=1048955 RepID=A0A9P4NW95_9PEZI|nr:hypothetical protein EJ08DRAFT_732197 [Tothia fuscella]
MKTMSQGNWSGHYAQYSHPPASPYTSTTSSAQGNSQSGYGQAQATYDQNYSNQQQQTWQTSAYPVDDTGTAVSGQSRSHSHSPTAGGGTGGTSERRREQNRLAQRALRQRRETHIRELENQVLQRSLQTRHLATENTQLHSQLYSVAQENDALRTQQIQGQASAHAWTQQQHAGAPTYNTSYAPAYSGGASGQYGGYTSYPSHSTSDPTHAASWGWNNTLNQSHIDPSHAWTGEEEDEDDDDSDDDQGQTTSGHSQWR